MARKLNEDKASSFGLFSMAAICAGLMVYVPNDAAKWGAGAIGAATALAGANRLREEGEQDRKRKAADIPSGIHGTAAFLTPVQAGQAGLYDPAGIYLGVFGGRMIFFAGKGHGITFAPARAGKGIGNVIPNLLHCQESVFVTDPKGELAGTTAVHRARAFGQKIVVLNPWGLHGLPQHRFNPLAFLVDMAKDEAGRRGLTEEVAALALQLYPEPADPRNGFFREGSRQILRALLLHLATCGEPERCTLPELWRIVNSVSRLQDELIEMAGSVALGGIVADMAEDLVMSLTGKSEAFHSFLQGAIQAVSIFDPAGWLADSLDRSDFSFSELKTGKVTIYLVIPPDRVATHGKWLGLLARRAIDAVARTPGRSKVLFMLDEFANMGKLAGLSEALTLLPGLGVRVWMIVQSLDHLRSVYGQDETSTILSQAEVKQFFAVRDHGLAKMLSDSLGNRTVVTRSTNLGRSEEDEPGESRSEAARPLMSPDEIRMMPENEQLLFIKALPPVRAERVPFWEVAPWQGWASPNPIEGDHPRPAVRYRLTYTEKTDA